MAKRILILLALNPSPILEIMERTLRAAEFEVVIAYDKAGVDKCLQEAFPDLMIIGEQFAAQDAFSISDELLERFPTLPIILYADQDTSAFAKSALKHCLSGYIYPPLKVEDITEEVQRSLNRARKLGDWLRREVKRTTSSLKEKAEISESERSKLDAIFANIQDGVIVLDEKKNILLANHAMYDIFNLAHNEIAGISLVDVINNRDLNALLARADAGHLRYHEINFDDGRVFNAQYTPIPKIGAAVTLQDISYLKELDRLKSDFINTVSHDLRSPLTSILGYTELIERTGPLNSNQQEFLRRLQGSIQHIIALVNELLDLGRLEAGFDTRRESVKLESVLEYTLDMFDGQIEEKKIKLTTDISSDLHLLHANPVRIRQMLDNLMGNAIKYTPAEGDINVSMSLQDRQVILKVQDTGVGIPAQEQGRIFEKFYRGTNVVEDVKGFGLGLSIVKSIVDNHQGRVWVESSVGKGSSFIVTLPAQE